MPDDVRDEFKSQIADAIASGRNLGLTVSSEDVLKGPLKAVEGDLVKSLSADHHSIKSICQQGARSLPFTVDPLKLKLDTKVKEWAQNLFSKQA